MLYLLVLTCQLWWFQWHQTAQTNLCHHNLPMIGGEIFDEVAFIYFTCTWLQNLRRNLKTFLIKGKILWEGHKIWSTHLVWQNSCFYSVVSKQVEDFFKFLWPSQKSWTFRGQEIEIRLQKWFYRIMCISYNQLCLYAMSHNPTDPVTYANFHLAKAM